MIKTRIVKSGFRTAWSHKLRAFFMILSVAVGIGALTVIISLGKGTQEEVMSRIKRLFSANAVLVMSGTGRVEGSQVHATGTTTLKLPDIEELAGRISGIAAWDAVKIALGQSVTYSGQNCTADLEGLTPAGEAVWNLAVTEGRFFTDAENRGLARVALLAPGIRKELFGSADPVGQQIQVGGVPFQVIGTIGPRGLDPHGMNLDEQIIVPLNTLLKRVTNTDYLTFAKFLVTDTGTLSATAEQMTQVLRERHHVAAGEESDFMVVTPAIVNQMVRRGTALFNLYLPLIALVALLVGSIVVVNLMLLSVSERVKEIGLRKAVGAKSRDIRSQFLIEASSITLAGGTAGILLGLLVLTQVTKAMHVPFVVSWTALIVCFVVSSLVGIAAGFVPARRAAEIQPAESLR